MLLEKIKSLAAQGQQENIAIRRHLHANPELSYQEFETCKFVQAELKKNRYSLYCNCNNRCTWNY